MFLSRILSVEKLKYSTRRCQLINHVTSAIY